MDSVRDSSTCFLDERVLKFITRLIYLTGEEDGVQGGEVRKSKSSVFDGMLTSIATDIDIVPSGS
jgi:hypothetical protein